MRGHRASFETLWRDHARLLHAIAVSMVPTHRVEDVVQDVALAAWRSISRLECWSRFRPWLCALARNRARDALRRPGPRHAPDGSLADVPTPGSTTLGAEVEEVLEHLRRLPACYREPLSLRLIAQCTGPEIAERLGMTKGSVRVNLHRGLALLRESLGASREKNDA